MKNEQEMRVVNRLKNIVIEINKQNKLSNIDVTIYVDEIVEICMNYFNKSSAL